MNSCIQIKERTLASKLNLNVNFQLNQNIFDQYSESGANAKPQTKYNFSSQDSNNFHRK